MCFFPWHLQGNVFLFFTFSLPPPPPPSSLLSLQTCAHRYQRRLFVNTPQESRDITGRCYVLSQDLTVDTSSDEDGGNWKFCEGRARGHERFGSCQQGLAATFTRDYHYLVFGAPGAYNWKGTRLFGRHTESQELVMGWTEEESAVRA